MSDNVSIPVCDLDRSADSFEAVLCQIGVGALAAALHWPTDGRPFLRPAA